MYIYICAMYLYTYTGTHARMYMYIYIYTGKGAVEMCLGGLFFSGGRGFRGEGEGKGRDILQTCPTNELVSWLHLMTLTGHRRAVGNNVMRVQRRGGGGGVEWGCMGVRVSAGQGGSGAEGGGSLPPESPPPSPGSLFTEAEGRGEVRAARGQCAAERGVKKPRVFWSEAVSGGGCRDIPVECAVGPRVRRPLQRAAERVCIFRRSCTLCGCVREIFKI